MLVHGLASRAGYVANRRQIEEALVPAGAEGTAEVVFRNCVGFLRVADRPGDQTWNSLDGTRIHLDHYKYIYKARRRLLSLSPLSRI